MLSQGITQQMNIFAYLTTTIFLIAFSQYIQLYVQSIWFPLEFHFEKFTPHILSYYFSYKVDLLVKSSTWNL